MHQTPATVSRPFKIGGLLVLLVGAIAFTALSVGHWLALFSGTPVNMPDKTGTAQYFPAAFAVCLSTPLAALFIVGASFLVKPLFPKADRFAQTSLAVVLTFAAAAVVIGALLLAPADTLAMVVVITVPVGVLALLSLVLLLRR